MKKRRLDELLSKKFSVTDSPPHSSESNRATPSYTSDGGVANDQSPLRRDSTEKRQNRRKRSSPQSCTSSSSPITLAVRPSSELLAEAKMAKAGEMKPQISAVEDEDDDKSAMKNQILQLHLAQAALLNQTSLFPGIPGFPGAAVPNPAAGNNPLLYYGYYAQMIQGLQSQQQKLLEQLTGKTKNNLLPSVSKVSCVPGPY